MKPMVILRSNKSFEREAAILPNFRKLFDVNVIQDRHTQKQFV